LQDAEQPAGLRDPLLPDTLWPEGACSGAAAEASNGEGGIAHVHGQQQQQAPAARTWTAREVCMDVFIPCCILVMGVGFSIAALYVAVQAYYD
jgi:hypothetical protein